MKLLSGTDSAEQKKLLNRKEKEADADTFGNIFREWYAHKFRVWSSGYADEPQQMSEDDILQLISHMKIEPIVLLKVIRLFEDRGAMERADKARSKCGEVFRYTILTGKAKYNPVPDLVDALHG